MLSKLVLALCTILSLVNAKESSKSFKIDLEKVRADVSTKRRLGHLQQEEETKSESTIRLTNYFNYQYIGTLYLGSNDQPMKLLFDTGSTWLWVPSSDCPATECTRGHYDWRQSTDYEDRKIAKDITYGMGYIKGGIVADKVSLQKGSSDASIQFILVDHAKDLSQLFSDGLVGLGPATDRNVEWNFMHQLQKQGVIDTAILALDIRDESQVSSAQFGAFDQSYIDAAQTQSPFPTKYQSTDGIFWMPNQSSIHWQVTLYSLWLQSESGALKQLSFMVDDVLLDSGSSLVYIPKTAYNQIMPEITNGRNCSNFEGSDQMKCDCTSSSPSSFPTLKLELGGEAGRHIFELSPETYVWYNWQEASCWIMIMPELASIQTWILGDPFLLGYYSIYDYDANRVGLVGPAETTFSSWQSNDNKGVISLTIGSAQLTRNTDWWGVMDPFVRIIHKDVTYTTTLIRNGGKDVSWYEPFEILVDMEDEITFIVLDDDFVSADIVGEVTAVVKDLLARGTDDFVLSLEYRGRSAGTLTASAWKIK